MSIGFQNSQILKFDMVESHAQHSACSLKQNNLKNTLIGCQRADIKLALSNTKAISNRYQDNKKVLYNVNVNYFKKYGSGIYLFFAFAKRLSICFIVLAIIYCFPILYNYRNGQAFKNDVNGGIGVILAKTSIANFNNDPHIISSMDTELSQKSKMYNAIPDIIVSVIFVCFYLYWQFKSDKMTEEINQTTQLQAYRTLQLVDFPKDATQQQIQAFFSQFGPLKEIATVKNYSEIISFCKEIYEIEQQKKQLLIMQQRTQDKQQKKYLASQVQNMNSEIDNLQKEALKYQKEASQEIIKYFIVFESPIDRVKALKKLKKYGKNQFKFNDRTPEKFKLNGQKVTVTPCHDEPGQIIWQNQHIGFKSRFARFILQLLLISCLLIIAFLIISTLNLATPANASYLDTSNYTISTIRNVRNRTIQYSWCLSNKDSQDAQIKSFCDDHISNYYKTTAVGILITLLIVIIKNVLKTIVIKLSHFQRHKSYTQQSADIMKNLFYTYVITTVLIPFCLQAELFGVDLKNSILLFFKTDVIIQNASLLATYDDFKPYWFAQIGYKIFLIVIIEALQVPLVNPIISFISEKIKRCRAQSILTQKSMEKVLKPQEFEIQDHYANTLLILFIAFTFSAGMPVIMISCAIGFFLRYFYFKITFIRFSCIPKSLDENLNETIINMLPFALLLHFSIGIWMYGSNYMFSDTSSFFDSKNSNIFIKRLSNCWYYSLAFFICALVVILKMIFYDLIYENLEQKKRQQKIPTKQFIQAKKQKNQKDNVIKMIAFSNMNDDKTAMDCPIDTSVMKKSKVCFKKATAITTSYKIENNPDYFQVMAIMGQLKNKQLKK